MQNQITLSPALVLATVTALSDRIAQLSGGDKHCRQEAERCRQALAVFQASRQAQEEPAAPPAPVRIIVHIEGGLVQNVDAAVPVEFAVIDADTEGADAADLGTLPGHDDPMFIGRIYDGDTPANFQSVWDAISAHSFGGIIADAPPVECHATRYDDYRGIPVAVKTQGGSVLFDDESRDCHKFVTAWHRGTLPAFDFEQTIHTLTREGGCLLPPIGSTARAMLRATVASAISNRERLQATCKAAAIAAGEEAGV